MVAPTWGVLTRRDLRTFDDVATDAVLLAMEHGAVGRITRKGHASLRAPDGRTMSVSRNTNKSQQVVLTNVRKLFGHLPKVKLPEEPAASNGQAAPVDPELHPTLYCPVPSCDKEFVTEGARYTHINKDHIPCKEPGCQAAFVSRRGMEGHHRIVHLGARPAKGDGSVYAAERAAHERRLAGKTLPRGRHAAAAKRKLEEAGQAVLDNEPAKKVARRDPEPPKSPTWHRVEGDATVLETIDKRLAAIEAWVTAGQSPAVEQLEKAQHRVTELEDENKRLRQLVAAVRTAAEAADLIAESEGE